MAADNFTYRFGPKAEFEFCSYQPKFRNALVQLLKMHVPKYFAEAEIEDYKYYLDKEVEAYFVVLCNDQVVGAGGINYFEKEELARISWDIVHPDWQGKGIGQHLTKFRVMLIKNNPKMKKAVVRTSQLAYKFYEKAGFVLKKTQDHYWAPNLHLYQMSMDLTETS